MRSIKQTELSPLEYLRKAQYLFDEGFVMVDSSTEDSIGLTVQSDNRRFWCSLPKIRSFQKIDVESFHGPAQFLAIGFNKFSHPELEEDPT